MEKNYEIDNDYILDVLEEKEDKLIEELNDSLPKQMKFEFAKFIAIRNQIEKININNAFEKGLYTTINKIC